MKNKRLYESSILLIDDQPLALSYMKQSLESLGFSDISIAENAKMALGLCQEHTFNLVLCSFNLGKLKDGYQLYEELKTKRLIKNICGFIFISAETDTSLVHSVIELQPDDFLAKPFSLKVFGERIVKLLKRKQALAQIYDFIDVGNDSKALRYVNEMLADSSKNHLSPILLKLRGELLLRLKRTAEAIDFFKSVLNIQKFTWARVGLVEAYIQNSEFTQAKNILEVMLTKPETRLVGYHLLGKLELFLENYQQAQHYLSLASKLAPRNIERQEDLIILSKFNHDHEKHFRVNKELVKYAKHSMHDKPDIYLNLARAGIDYALTLDQADIVNRLTRQSNECLSELRKQFPDSKAQEQIDVINARIHYLKDERSKAIALVEQLEDQPIIRSVDDTLDKAKAFHELGMHHKANQLFAKLTEHCGKYQSDNAALNAYLKQEQQERDEIRHSPKELNNNAVHSYEKGKYEEALNYFTQAFRIMPKNANIALNLLQVMLDTKHPGSQSLNKAMISRCMDTINNAKLDAEQQARLDKLKPMINSVI
ncbi:Transcriptional activator protein CzcR [Pseudoalteromonas sp. P1-9]|uniref:response regulator n=1 Tax=Pseudoalteromonas sp. P1-9 TaxID=1710354 RepID=UPI0006D6033A|nr:response regulator [Pseudoalteromonas sp. P1-9]KPV95378.1 Transcriptional activator protein CzcR [Pseudoalteromonas sp. P1-9]